MPVNIPASGANQSLKSVGSITTGSRWCISLIRSPAAVVTTAQVTCRCPVSGDVHACQMPPRANRSAPSCVKYHGSLPLPAVRCHSKNPDTGTRQRRFCTASRKAGFSVMVSDRALIKSGPSVGDLYQCGINPQRMGVRYRSPPNSTATGISCVGQTLYRGSVNSVFTWAASKKPATASWGNVRANRPHFVFPLARPSFPRHLGAKYRSRP